MATPKGGVGVRLFVGGGPEAKRDFQAFRDDGKRAFAELAMGANGVNPALLAMSRGIGEVRTGVADLAQGTGAAGRILSSFGVAGIAFAAVLGGIAVAAAQTREALKFADDIADSATKVGVGAEALQAYRYAIHQAGGEFKDADTAIQGFKTALGGAESGLSPRLLKAFKSLGFDADDLKRMKDDIPSALAEVTDRIAKLGSEAERAAVADKLGLTPMLPVIRLGSERMAELTDEARKLGFVMSQDVLDAASDANDKLEVLSQVIDIQLKTAFVELAPVIVESTQALADLLKGVAKFANDPKVKWVGNFVAGLAANGGNAYLAASDANAKSHQLPDDFGMDVDDPDAIRHALRAKGGGGTSLVNQGKGTKAKPLPHQPIDEDSILSPYDPITGKLVKPLTPQEEAFQSIFGYRPDAAPEAKKVKIAVDADLTVANDNFKAWLKEAHDATRDSFAGGIRAAFDGNLLDYIKERLTDSLVDGLAEGLTNAFEAAMKSTGTAQTGNFLVDIGTAIFSRHAMGGPTRPGEVSSVAEYGDELAFFGRGGRVYNHDETVQMLRQVAGGSGGDGVTVQVTYAPSYQVTGSGPELDRLRGEMQRDRDSFKTRVVGAVNDGLQRRQIKAA